MENIVDRVRRMESYMDDVAAVMKNKSKKLKKGSRFWRKVAILTDYMDSGQWLADYEADERGELPADLKRGVLSQDGLYNLICEIGEKRTS